MLWFLAEFFVARAVHAQAPIPIEWDDYDVEAAGENSDRGQGERLSTGLGAEQAFDSHVQRQERLRG